MSDGVTLYLRAMIKMIREGEFLGFLWTTAPASTAGSNTSASSNFLMTRACSQVTQEHGLRRLKLSIQVGANLSLHWLISLT